MLPLPELTIAQFKSRIRFFVVLLIIAVIGILAWHIDSERNAIITAAELQSQGYSRALSEHAGSAFAEADRALREVVNDIAERGGIDHIERRTLFNIIRRQGGDTPQIGSIFLTDRSGIMVVNSLEFPSKQINVSDREYFIFDRDKPDTGLFISRPLISRLVNRWRFTMTRPLTYPDGRFAGLAAVAFEINYFHRFYTSISLGPRGKVQLIRTDGSPLLSEPFTENAFAVDFKRSALFRDHLGTTQSGTFHDNKNIEDQSPRIVSYHRLSRFPVVAVVSLHRDDILTPWKRKVTYETATTLGLCLALFLLMQLLLRHLDQLQATQNSLREQQEQVRIKAAQIDSANDAILLMDTDGRLVHFNNALCQMIGYDQNELQGALLHDFEPPEFAARLVPAISSIMEHGEAIFESAYLTKRGAILPVEVHARTMESEGTKRILSIVRDISERKHSELREQTRLRILEEMATGVDLSELLTNIVRFVEQERKGLLCSISIADETGQFLRHGAAPSLPQFYNKAVDGVRIAEGMGCCGTAAHRRQRVVVEDVDGDPLWKGFRPVSEAGLRACWSEPVKSSQGELLGTFACYHRERHAPDETEIQLIESAAHLASIAIERFKSEELKSQLEAQLHHVQKIEAIGQLAGGIAHDFNNLLTPIIGYADMIQHKLPEGDPLSGKVNGITAAAFKARDLTQQLLSFGRKQMLDMKSVDLNQVLGNFQDILRRTIRENITIDIRLASGGIAIWADRGQIEQILLNLVVNAQDAISGNGMILMETGHVMLDNEYTRLHPGVQPGPYALLDFSDNGCGMNDETLSHIFEPFFTTKQVGHGTGLGLATVYGIIKQHEGYISVKSRVGEGTTFSIYLPLSREPITTTSADSVVTATTDGATTGERTILVVEDNEMVRTMTVELLESSGYRVLVADRPSAAVELMNRYGNSVALLVSDVIMPEMSGQELHENLLETFPDLKVLYISGYTNELFVHRGMLEEGVNFLQKPFTTEKLLKEVQRIASEAEEPANQLSFKLNPC
ncbi:ATP-binding protein [Geotalea uraniireducens]|uniref:histidine kinase n=1 Tax=Geotalea uraniireducens (strain Rf4) TaxID=351605 RepID=A5GFK8_GEOUR|nr:ATP-binding protein [Geotalea uraniireducens]ABQ26213.1 multi-sensor hybrid histidine kinase [Geotalea uraniireducens Rf4]